MANNNFKYKTNSPYFNDIDDQIDIDPADELQVDIDMDEINNDSIIYAKSIIQNLKNLYCKNILKDQPELAKQIDSEMDSLRKLIKMSKSSERIHDVLIQAIGNKPSNASLYGALSKIQQTMLSTQKQIEDTITRLSNIMKDYQYNINFDQNNDLNDNDLETNTNIHRGSKSYIEQMKQQILNKNIEPQLIFEDESEGDD